MNEDNVNFYNDISQQAMETRLHELALHTLSDVALVADLVQRMDIEGSLIWEVGAGYGRVVEFLLENTAAATVEAWEYTPRMAAFLRQEFRSHSRLRVTERSILEAPAEPRNLGLALWMFSGILEFSPDEQERALALICRRLQPGGYLVVDIGGLELAEKQEFVRFSAAEGPHELKTYLLTRDRLNALAGRVGLSSVRECKYWVAGSPRLSCVYRAG